MKNFVTRTNDFIKSEDGPTTTEYAVMLTLVIVALIASITALKDKVLGIFTTTGAAIG